MCGGVPVIVTTISSKVVSVAVAHITRIQRRTPRKKQGSEEGMLILAGV